MEKQHKAMGLPDTRDPQYEEKIEAILQEMVEDKKLNYHPLDQYSWP